MLQIHRISIPGFRGHLETHKAIHVVYDGKPTLENLKKVDLGKVLRCLNEAGIVSDGYNVGEIFKALLEGKSIRVWDTPSMNGEMFTNAFCEDNDNNDCLEVAIEYSGKNGRRLHEATRRHLRRQGREFALLLGNLHFHKKRPRSSIAPEAVRLIKPLSLAINKTSS